MELKNRIRLASALALLVCLLWPAASLGQDEENLVEWPRQLDGERAQIIMYQPQLESYSGDKLEARAAVSVTVKGETEPVFGAVWIEARVATDMDTRMVSLESVRVTTAQFPSAEEEDVQTLIDYLEEEIPKWEMVMSMDRLLAGLDNVEGLGQEEGGLNHDAPELIVVTSPTVLVMIDGDPILADLDYEGLKYVTNSPFYILQDPGTGRYFLKGGDYWYVAPDLTADWVVAEDLPTKVADVAKEVAKQEQEAEQGEETTSEDGEGDEPAPDIMVRTKPAELIQINGEPELASIEGTDLLYIRNTESDVIMDIAAQQYYLLVAGRWYASDAMTGSTWTHVPPDEVPASFAQIPESSDVANVRASVAGTQEAREAVLETSIPQTAEVDRKTATVTVEYDGDPQFERCADDVAYAINTNKSVVLVDGTYYCCDEAIWFVSPGPEGPWEVATYVPDAIQDIPADCPVQNVKYVHIYESTPEVVYVGYLPGYGGSHVYHGCVVYGTGVPVPTVVRQALLSPARDVRIRGPLEPLHRLGILGRRQLRVASCELRKTLLRRMVGSGGLPLRVPPRISPRVLSRPQATGPQTARQAKALRWTERLQVPRQGRQSHRLRPDGRETDHKTGVSGDKTGVSGDKTGHSGDKTSHSRDKTGHSRDKASHSRDKTGHSRDKTGHSGDKTSDKTGHSGDKTSDKTGHSDPDQETGSG